MLRMVKTRFCFIAIIAFAAYCAGMKSPPWAIQKNNDETKLKEEFAEILLKRPHEAFEVAKLITGDSENVFGLVYTRSKSWPNDPYVKQHQQKLIDQFGESYFLPTRSEIIHEFWHRIRERDGGGNRMMDQRDAITAATMIGNMAGYLTKSPSGSGSGEGDTIFKQNVNINFVSPEATQINDTKVIEHEPSEKPVEMLSDLTFED